jgi:Flp pilus assembly protein TadD
VVHYHLGLAYAKAGEKVRARGALEQALKLKKDFDGAADARKVLATL